MKKLYRSRDNKAIWGVCGGLGEYMDIDPVVIRIVYLTLTLGLLPFMVILYLIAWKIIPENPNQVQTVSDTVQDQTDRRFLWGAVLIAFGFLLLMQNLGFNFARLFQAIDWICRLVGSLYFGRYIPDYERR